MPPKKPAVKKIVRCLEGIILKVIIAKMKAPIIAVIEITIQAGRLK